MNVRAGTIADVEQIQNLVLATWKHFETVLEPEHWSKLYSILMDTEVFVDLLTRSDSFLCENEKKEIVGTSFLVPSGNPTEIYNDQQCSIRFVTVAPAYQGQKIGQKLTEKCIAKARENKETVIALHTSEFMNDARHIYEKLGFKVVRELEPRLGKRYWLYELSL